LRKPGHSDERSLQEHKAPGWARKGRIEKGDKSIDRERKHSGVPAKRQYTEGETKMLGHTGEKGEQNRAADERVLGRGEGLYKTASGRSD